MANCCNTTFIPSGICDACDEIISTDCVIQEQPLLDPNGNNVTQANTVQSDINQLLTTLIFENTGSCDLLSWNNIIVQDFWITPLEYKIFDPSGTITLGTTRELQYSQDPCNGKVYLRGGISRVFSAGDANGLFLIGNIPIPPINLVVHTSNSFIQNISGVASFVKTVVVIDTSGDIKIFIGNDISAFSTTGVDLEVIVSLDGFSYEIN